MLTLNYRYRIYPNITEAQTLVEWMETCRVAYNYALREIKDWCDSRKCAVDRCSLEREYILAADLKFPTEVNQLNSLPKAKKEFPRLGEVPSQVLQQAIKQLHRGWEYFQQRGFGFPRFKKYGQLYFVAVSTVQGKPSNKGALEIAKNWWHPHQLAPTYP
jgi:putative transposase